MGNDILVFIEAREGKINPVSWQAVTAAKTLAGSTGGHVVAVALGPGLDGQLADAGKFGAASVKYFNTDALAAYTGDGFSRAIASVAKQISPKAVLIPATAMGKDLAPRVAVRLDAGLAVDCTGLSANGGKITAVRPVVAGKLISTVECSSESFVISVRPNAFPATETGGSATVESFDADLGEIRDRVVKTERAAGGAKDVAEAEIIVAGGRGLVSPENFEALILPLADVLGAAHGASRAIVDAGWRPHAEQVGQTGKTVSPKLYIACGISGAIQHKAGMDSSKCIVAINKDKDAAIFQFADYGIVGDCSEILPRLTAELKTLLGK